MLSFTSSLLTAGNEGQFCAKNSLSGIEQQTDIFSSESFELSTKAQSENLGEKAITETTEPAIKQKKAGAGDNM